MKFIMFTWAIEMQLQGLQYPRAGRDLWRPVDLDFPPAGGSQTPETTWNKKSWSCCEDLEDLLGTKEGKWRMKYGKIM